MTKSNGFRKCVVIGVGLKVVFVCMIGIISVHGIKTYAANNSDTYFSFSFERGGTNETSRRYKDDTSAAWMSCVYSDNADIGYNAYVYGYESNYSKDPLCCSYAKGFYVWDKKYIRNTVRENGKNFASIVGQLKEDECVGYKGEWSPDNCSGY